jgi:hypothetical protein
MAGRTRTTKKLAQRIDLNYFKKAFPIPRWRWLLSIGLTVAGLAWLGWDALSGKQAYNAGPVSRGHTLLTNNCTACHAVQAVYGTKVTDTACLACHDAPVHQAKQTFTPACTDCHVEHQGSFRLAAASAQACAQCHSNLTVTEGQPRFAATISTFTDGHPEFAAVRQGHPPDPGTIKLNHQIHLQANLRGPQGPVQLQCVNCHEPVLHNGSADMMPVDFGKHCASCHPLLFDKRFPEPAPHKDPATVDEFVVRKYTTYIAQHPNEAREPVTLNRDLPSRPIPPVPVNARQWVAQRVDEAERLLWQKSCKECHPVTFPVPGRRPEIPKAAIPVRWMNNSHFSHAAHQLVACAECHTQAATSQMTSDVLLPGIATCQKCHDGGRNSAETRCFECHAYHDWSKAKPVHGSAQIPPQAASIGPFGRGVFLGWVAWLALGAGIAIFVAGKIGSVRLIIGRRHSHGLAQS